MATLYAEISKIHTFSFCSINLILRNMKKKSIFFSKNLPLLIVIRLHMKTNNFRCIWKLKVFFSFMCMLLFLSIKIDVLLLCENTYCVNDKLNGWMNCNYHEYMFLLCIAKIVEIVFVFFFKFTKLSYRLWMKWTDIWSVSGTY